MVAAWDQPECCNEVEPGDWADLGALICEVADLAALLHLQHPVGDRAQEESAARNPRPSVEGDR